jgi:hypothetical protein
VALVLFDEWTLAECRAAIKDLERGIALGVKTISYPNGGGTEHVSRAEALQTLRGLKAQRDRLLGVPDPSANGGIRFVRGLPRRTF